MDEVMRQILVYWNTRQYHYCYPKPWKIGFKTEKKSKNSKAKTQKLTKLKTYKIQLKSQLNSKLKTLAILCVHILALY